eukprot:5961226-Amphidinium_carterae.1
MISVWTRIPSYRPAAVLFTLRLPILLVVAVMPLSAQKLCVHPLGQVPNARPSGVPHQGAKTCNFLKLGIEKGG